MDGVVGWRLDVFSFAVFLARGGWLSAGWWYGRRHSEKPASDPFFLLFLPLFCWDGGARPYGCCVPAGLS
jgi:hypothetical protein